MKNTDSLLVICVDRDNDLGRKTGIQGPVIGRRAVLNAAAKLAVADPEESDANCMFAAIKKFDEIKEEIHEIEVVALTGVDKGTFKSDRQINEQLDTVLDKFPAEGFVLVTDGAEDDQVIPILQNKMRLISKEIVIIKQAKEVESTYYTIMEALKDPAVSRFLLIPAVIFLAYFFFGSLSLQIVALVIGFYLLLKGFGLEEPIVSGARNFSSSFSIQRLSFPFYLGSIFIPAFGAVTAYTVFSSSMEIELVQNAVQSAQQAYFFFALGAISFVLGKSIDVVHFRKAFALRKYFFYGVSIPLVWFILDAGTQVFLKQADLNWFLGSIVFSFIALLLAYQASKIFDIRMKITKLFLGLPVYDRQGRWVGKIDSVEEEKGNASFQNIRTKETTKIKKKEFMLRDGRIILTG